jgi:hypothetical protein
MCHFYHFSFLSRCHSTLSKVLDLHIQKLTLKTLKDDRSEKQTNHAKTIPYVFNFVILFNNIYIHTYTVYHV